MFFLGWNTSFLGVSKQKEHSLKEALGLLRWFEDLNFEVDVISLLVPRYPWNKKSHGA